ncbi:MAG: RNA methyltransferase [Lachnospiraceae bacterium]|nr:RNA methyltransferase [Lachnospiraceae bacterium]
MITSTANAQVKNLAQLIKKSKARTEQGVYVVEGVKMFQEAPGEEIVKAYISEELYEKGTLKNSLEGISYEVLKNEVFNHVADTKTPQGVLCILKQKKYTLEQLTDSECPLLLVLENLQDPGNLGTMMRTAEGAGVSGVLLSRGCVDIYNPKTIRSTMGSIYRVPFLYTDDLLNDMDRLHEKGIVTYAAHLKGKGYYDEVSYKEPTAFLIGNEGNGLSDEVSEKAKQYIKIPMEGQLESLNAAVAAAILMYEASRQRR